MITHQFGRRFSVAYQKLLRIRREHTAFHPNAEQLTIDLGNPTIFALMRTSQNERILILCNVSRKPQEVQVDQFGGATLHDLLSDLHVQESVHLEAYQVAWLAVR